MVPIAPYETAYAAEGLPFPQKVKAFLRHFGGLIIRYGTPAENQDVLEFLAERAVQGMGRGGNKGFEELVGVAPLCPIGHYQYGTCILFMDRRGRVFGGSDEAVTLVGSTGEEAINNILCGIDGKILEPRKTA